MTIRRPVLIGLTPQFRKAIKRLERKYRHVADDLKSLTDQLKQGETPGDQIPGTRYTVYKARLRNTDARHGQSGGYRVIYYIRTPVAIHLLYIHTKAESESLSNSFIQSIIEEIE